MKRHGIGLAALATAVVALLSAGSEAAAQPLPSTTLACADFKKNPDGSWVVADDRPFTIGGATMTINTGTVIRPNSVKIEGADFYAVLEARCAGSAK